MSISVKNITLSIDGTQSNKFKIELSGAQYNLDNFCLEQRLLEPNRLTFTMCKDPIEDISEPQFTVCSDIIGKPVKLTLQTDSMELDIAKFVAEGKVADIEFDGIIASASATRSESHYLVQVEAYSWDVLFKDNPNCKSFEDMTLQDIIFDVITSNGQLQASVNPRFEAPIPYTVQYNETNYEFLQRLARRYGEWFFNDGTIWHFGQLGEPDTTTLKYPSQDVSSYSVRVNLQHVPFKLVANSYNANDSTVKEGKEEMEKSMNTLNDSVYDASNKVYTKDTLQNLHSGGYATVDSRDTILNTASKTQARGERANMLIYEGNTYCSNLKIGSKLAIKDNYITGADTNDKSEVPQDEILITALTHQFTCDEVYSNTFEGIPAACDYPPYQDLEVYPHCPPSRAMIVDNEDPDQLGRVRVQFSWQLQQDYNMFTPWLRIAQPYGGKEKGFSFIPEIGEEVLVDFESGNAERPYVRGSFFNGVDSPDARWLPGKNEVKAIRTKNGHTIEFHDKGKGGYIRIYDNKKNNYTITLSSDNKLVKIQSKGNVEVSADKDITLTAGQDMKINVGRNMNVNVGKTFDMTVDSVVVEPPEPIMSSYEDAVCKEEPKATTVPLFNTNISNGLINTISNNRKEEVRAQWEIKAPVKEDKITTSYHLDNPGGEISLFTGTLEISGKAETLIQSTAAATFKSNATMLLEAQFVLMN